MFCLFYAALLKVNLVSASRNKYKVKQAAHIGHAAKNKRLLNASKY
jgi:hypothetical protein